MTGPVSKANGPHRGGAGPALGLTHGFVADQGAGAPESAGAAQNVRQGPGSRDAAASTLREDIRTAGVKRKREASPSFQQKHSLQSKTERQRALLDAHGILLQDDAPGFDEIEEKRIEAALATLLSQGGARDDPESNVRVAFLVGNKEKIQAAMALHQLGLLDPNAPGEDGDMLAHAIVRTSDPNYAAFNLARSDIMTIAERIASLQEAGADLNRRNRDGHTPVEVALMSGAPDMATTVDALAAAGVDFHRRDDDGQTLLHVMARRNEGEAIAVLLARGLDMEAVCVAGETPLHMAAANGHVGAMNALLAGGADINAARDGNATPLHLAAESGHVDAIKFLIARGADVEGEHSTTPLRAAARDGHIDAMNVLLASGADIHASSEEGLTALHDAAQNGHIDAMNFLLARGAHIETEGDLYAPMHSAAGGGHIEAIHVLLARGANIEAADGWGPLHAAAQGGRIGAMNVLLASGANVNASDLGLTPLRLAARWGCIDAMNVLLANGADVSMRSSQGRTVYEEAQRDGRVEVVNALLRHCRLI